MKNFLIIILCALSLGAYSQCPIPLQSKVIKWCGAQMTISADIVDSSDFHYDWRYPSDSDGVVSKGNPAPYHGPSFILSKAGFDSLVKMTKIQPYFMLRITSDSGCASNWVAINITHFPKPIETPSICLVTIDSANHNHLVLAQPSQRPDSISIQRLSGASWKNVATIERSGLLEFTDNTSDASRQTYSYRLISYLWDSCLLQTNASAPSVIHTSILLQVSPNPLGGFNLSWSKYVGLNDSELLGYYIYRGGNYASMAIIDTTQSLQNVAFNDPNNENAQFFYVIEAIKKGGCDTGQHLKKSLSIRSNPALRKVNGIAQIDNRKPVIRLENSTLYSDRPVSIYITNAIGQVTYLGKSDGALSLPFTNGLNIVVVNNGEAFLKVVR